MSEQLVDHLVNMKEKEALALASELLAASEDPLKVLEQCREAMDIVGKRFESGEAFLPELIMAGEMLRQISEVAKPKMTRKIETKGLGRIIIATVEGDIHDIGKDIVTFMLDVSGFEVRDLGVDVPVQRVVDEIKDFSPAVVGLSGFLTLAFDSMKRTIDAINEAGHGGSLKIMIGGGQIDETVRRYSGADAYGRDAVAAVSLAKQWIGGE